MSKKAFFLFSGFVGLCMLVAWQLASIELADVKENTGQVQEEHSTELVNTDLVDAELRDGK